MPLSNTKQVPLNPLEAAIAGEIARGGPIDVGRFMALALGHPVHGYYMKQDPLGAAGDFTTAPEISQMFGEMIGAWAADVWKQLGSPARFSLVECGPGRGTLMADLLRAAKGVEGFCAAAQIHLIEMSQVLREKQKAALAGFDAVWHADLSSVPADAPIILIANEFLDALPIRQFVKTDAGWVERLVGWDKGRGFCFVLAQERRKISAFTGMTASYGDIFEISPAREGFVSSCAEILQKASGAALFIDYGHAQTACGETLQAVRDHRYVSVFEDVGNCDLTSHVDFAALAARAGRVSIHGPVTQGDFLKAMGIMQRAESLKRNATPRQAAEINAALQRLTASDQMGALFKVMGLSYGAYLNPAGF